ncbi:MAG: flagellar hook capping FlgD N-terminal domain-containing protein [Yoonia sp.]|uniref:flagellar hook capping FlgD N-terminal domain-containing protein n=1 Tax=Yoonia sp. TaxID=2212373 RepID=UPI003EF25141
MDVLQTPPAPNTAMIPAANSEDAGTQLSSDFEVFLQMLTAQMKYQDPLNPVDSTDYATQLATFSGVEQAVLTNDLLKAMTSQMAVGGLSDLASWVGRDARSTAPAYFDGEPIRIFPQQVGAADQYELIVRDANGIEQQRLPYVPTGDGVDWAGVDANGAPLPNGLFRFQVVGLSEGVVTSQADVETYNRVTEVRIDAGQTVLIMRGGAVTPSTGVSALRDAAV